MRTVAALVIAGALAAPARAGEFPGFERRTIDRHVGEVCYAVAVADLDGDGRPDVVAATEEAVVWYANPGWARRDVVRGATPPDNVCLAAHDLDGDGRVDLALGAGWGPYGTRATEALQWLTRPDGSDRWAVRTVGPAPSLHRVRWGNILGDGRRQLVLAPLQGPGVREPDWGAGPGVRITVRTVPPRPEAEPWPEEVADEGLHTAHGVELADLDGDGRDEILVAAWEGVFLLRRGPGGKWSRERIGAGRQEPGPSKGASEVRLGRLADGRRFLATVEPWHGSALVLYTPPASGRGLWDRRVVDPDVDCGHALACVDLDGDGDDEVVVGRRDANHDLAAPPDGMGVIAYDPRPSADGGAPSFARRVLDEAISVEDLVAADLDADGRPDLVVGGRETHDVVLLRNLGPRP